MVDLDTGLGRAKLLALARQALDQLFCLAACQDRSQGDNLAPLLVLEVWLQQVGQFVPLVTAGILLLDEATGGQVFLEGEVSELVDGLQFTVDPFVAGLHQQATAVFDALDELRWADAGELQLGFEFTPCLPQEFQEGSVTDPLRALGIIVQAT